MSEETLPYKLEIVLCPLCGNEKYSVYIEGAKDLYNNLEGEFNVVKCDNCNFAYTNPRPTRETISYFYPDSAGYYQPDEKKEVKKEKLKERLFKSCLSRYYGYNMPKCIGLLDYFYHVFYKKKFYKKHIPHFVNKGKLIDVGCSYGKWLKQMKDFGWDVYGIEFNESAVEYAQTQLGLQNVALGSVENVPFEDAYFDVVHMSMVLEHVHDPVNVLKKVSQIMKKRE